jgi:putative membrane protein
MQRCIEKTAMDEEANTVQPLPWHKAGSDPDYRFSLANERTFLAWIRTALAVLAGALILHQLAAGLHLAKSAIWATSSLTLLSAVLAIGAYQRWKSNEIAMRHAMALPKSGLLALLAAAMATISIVALKMVLFN